jgi:hypothetical protein
MAKEEAMRQYCAMLDAEDAKWEQNPVLANYTA